MQVKHWTNCRRQKEHVRLCVRCRFSLVRCSIKRKLRFQMHVSKGIRNDLKKTHPNVGSPCCGQCSNIRGMFSFEAKFDSRNWDVTRYTPKRMAVNIIFGSITVETLCSKTERITLFWIHSIFDWRGLLKVGFGARQCLDCISYVSEVALITARINHESRHQSRILTLKTFANTSFRYSIQKLPGERRRITVKKKSIHGWQPFLARLIKFMQTWIRRTPSCSAPAQSLNCESRAEHTLSEKQGQVLSLSSPKTGTWFLVRPRDFKKMPDKKHFVKKRMAPKTWVGHQRHILEKTQSEAYTLSLKINIQTSRWDNVHSNAASRFSSRCQKAQDRVTCCYRAHVETRIGAICLVCESVGF